MVIIGYSGHAFVACSIFKAAGIAVTAYCDNKEKAYNPFYLSYLGKEDSEEAQAAFKAPRLQGQRAARRRAAHRVEAGVTDGWWKYGCAAVVGIDRYGESAPGGTLFTYLKLTAGNVADTVRVVLGR